MKAGPQSLERMAEREVARRLNSSKVARQFGFGLVAAEPGRSILRMRVQARHKQAHGVVHGGVLAALADTAGALATYMSLPRGKRIATVEMKINYLEPVEKGTVFAEARVLRKGMNLAVADCDLRDGDGLLVAKAILTFSIDAREDTARGKPRL